MNSVRLRFSVVTVGHRCASARSRIACACVRCVVSLAHQTDMWRSPAPAASKASSLPVLHRHVSQQTRWSCASTRSCGNNRELGPSPQLTCGHSAHPPQGRPLLCIRQEVCGCYCSACVVRCLRCLSRVGAAVDPANSQRRVQRAACDLVGADSCVVVAMRTCFAQHRVRRVLRRRTFAKAVRRVEDGLQ